MRNQVSDSHFMQTGLSWSQELLCREGRICGNCACCPHDNRAFTVSRLHRDWPSRLDSWLTHLRFFPPSVWCRPDTEGLGRRCGRPAILRTQALAEWTADSAVFLILKEPCVG